MTLKDILIRVGILVAAMFIVIVILIIALVLFFTVDSRIITETYVDLIKLN